MKPVKLDEPPSGCYVHRYLYSAVGLAPGNPPYESLTRLPALKLSAICSHHTLTSGSSALSAASAAAAASSAGARRLCSLSTTPRSDAPCPTTPTASGTCSHSLRLTTAQRGADSSYSRHQQVNNRSVGTPFRSTAATAVSAAPYIDTHTRMRMPNLQATEAHHAPPGQRAPPQAWQQTPTLRLTTTHGIRPSTAPYV
jgi:hypothetical protein